MKPLNLTETVTDAREAANTAAFVAGPLASIPSQGQLTAIVTAAQEAANTAAFIANLLADAIARGAATPSLDAVTTHQAVFERAAATRAAAEAAGDTQPPEEKANLDIAHHGPK